MVFQAPDLKVVVEPRRLRGPLVTGRHPHRWIIFALFLPALLLVGLLLIWPIAVTAGEALQADPPWRSPVVIVVVALLILAGVRWGVGRRWESAGSFRGWNWMPLLLVLLAVFVPPLGGSSLDKAGRLAFGITIRWIGLGFVLLLIGAWIAWATRRRRLWLPLVLPVGVSALVSGVVFRLMFDPTPERGPFAGLFNWLDAWLMPAHQQSWIWFVLLSAFAWIWLPFVVSLFRAGIDAIYADPAKRAYLEGPEPVKKQENGSEEEEPRWYERLRRSGRQFRRSILLSRQVVLLIIVTISVAAARVFDLVLIAVPGSLQYDVDTAGVHWWRLVESGRDPEGGAAFAVLLGLLVGVIAWQIQRGTRHHQHGIGRPARPRPPDQETGRKRRPWGLTVLAALVTGLWLLPFAVLLLTAFHTPADAARTSWLTWDRFSFDSFAQVLDIVQLWDSFATTAWVAVLATVSVLLLASPVAYILAALPASGLRSRVAVAVLVVLAVMPVQLYIEQLRDFVSDERLAGTRVPLILVHVAAGLPFAVLVLRGALLAPKDSPASDALYGLTSRGTTLRRIWRRAGPALAAVAVLELVLVWNDFIISFLLSGSGASPLSLLLWGEARQFAVASGTVAAGAVLASIPPIVLIVLTWRRLVVPGLTGGVLR
jgi:alpha-glucoside transport system permease protein